MLGFDQWNLSPGSPEAPTPRRHGGSCWSAAPCEHAEKCEGSFGSCDDLGALTMTHVGVSQDSCFLLMRKGSRFGASMFGYPAAGSREGCLGSRSQRGVCRQAGRQAAGSRRCTVLTHFSLGPPARSPFSPTFWGRFPY